MYDKEVTQEDYTREWLEAERALAIIRWELSVLCDDDNTVDTSGEDPIATT